MKKFSCRNPGFFIKTRRDVTHILTATHAHMKKIKAEGRVVDLIHTLCEIAVENHVEK